MMTEAPGLAKNSTNPPVYVSTTAHPNRARGLFGRPRRDSRCFFGLFVFSSPKCTLESGSNYPTRLAAHSLQKVTLLQPNEEGRAYYKHSCCSSSSSSEQKKEKKSEKGSPKEEEEEEDHRRRRRHNSHFLRPQNKNGIHFFAAGRQHAAAGGGGGIRRSDGGSGWEMKQRDTE